ncbi:purine-cytosine permease family protein [Glutamicibacter uratoxydans]|uniref:purine-cytosine permease family protein n=1 Tax=Glutamicibacter uratoxydans TaxID=43667 RepID=UPI003D6FE10B
MSRIIHSTLPEMKSRSTDDPQVVAAQRANDYSNHMVPITARIGRWQLTMSYWSLLSAMIWIFYGALVAGLYGSVNAVIAIVLSVVTYSIMGGIFTRWGIRSGLNSAMLTRRMFGTVGALLTAFLVSANTVYYAVFESSTLAVAFQYYTPDWDIRIWYAIVVVAMLPLMLGGVQTWMGRMNGILLPFYGLGLILVLVLTAVNYDSQGWMDFAGIVPEEARAYPGWLLGFVLYMGVWLLLPTTQDFARFGKIEDEKFHTVVSFGPVFYFFLFLVNGVAGIFLVRTVVPNEATAEAGVVIAILGASGLLGRVFIAVSQIRINSLNFYQASTNWNRIWTGVTGKRVHRAIWILLIGTLVFLLMLTNVFSYLERALTWQGVFLVGWATVALTHYVMVPKDRRVGPEFRAGRLPKFTLGLLVWVIAAGAGIAVAEIPGVPPVFSAVPALVTLVIAAVLYATLLVLRPEPVKTGMPDPHTEVSDAQQTWIQCHSCELSYVAWEMDRDPNHDLEPICDACSMNH